MSVGPLPSPPSAPPGVLERVVRAIVQAMAGGAGVRGPAWAGWPAGRAARIGAAAAWAVVLSAAFVVSLVSLRASHRAGGPLPGPLGTTLRNGDAAFASLLASLPLLTLRWSPVLTARLMAIGLAWIVFISGERPVWPWPPSTLVVYAAVLVIAARSLPPSRVANLWVWTMPALWISGRGAPAGVLVAMGGAAALLLVLGIALRDRTQARAELAVASAQRDAESNRSAVLSERTRIARDLHDVVAHHMAMISIQAQAAPLRFPGIPEEAQETFALIERAAREALSETRGIVGLLRGEGERVPAGGGALSAPTAQGTRAPPSAHGGELAPTSPAPSIESIPDLVDAARSGGMPVSLAMSGSTLGIADSTALAAYRMVQEGLANAATHAPGAPVQVEIVRQGAGLRVAILNGPPPGGEP